MREDPKARLVAHGTVGGNAYLMYINTPHMKKLIIAAIVGGFIAYAWQTASHTFLDLHYRAESHTPKQDTILAFFESIGLEEGNYLVPRLPRGASQQEMDDFGRKLSGRPWGTVTYRKSWNADMGSNILRGLLVTVLMAGMLAWILMKMASPSTSTILLTSVFVGLIGYLTFPYAAHIWYKVGDARADLVDSVVMWGLCGLWLSWWLRRP